MSTYMLWTRGNALVRTQMDKSQDSSPFTLLNPKTVMKCGWSGSLNLSWSNLKKHTNQCFHIIWEPKLRKSLSFFSFLLKIYLLILFVNQIYREKRSNKDKDFPSIDSLPTWLQQPELCQLETRSQGLLMSLQYGRNSTRDLGHCSLLFQAKNRETGWKQSSPHTNQYPYRCWCLKGKD